MATRKNVDVPPHNEEAERALLGCALLDPKTLDEMMDVVHADDFYRESHRNIFTALVNMRNRGDAIDSLTLKDALDSDGTLEDSGGAVYIIDIQTAVPSSHHWKEYADIVRKNSIARRLVRIGVNATALGYSAPDDIDSAVAEVQSAVMGLSLATQKDTIPVGTVLSDLWKSIREGGQPHISPPGLPWVRFRDGDLIVIGAGTSVGKTALTLHWVDEWSKSFPCAYFEYEMPESDLIARLVCKHAGVQMSQLQDCDLNAEELDRVQDAMLQINSRKLKLEEVWCDITTLMAKIRREALSGTEMIVIDHLGLVPFKRTKGMNEAKAIGVFVTNPLKRLAAELGIKIVLLVQMNRAGQDPSNFPKLHHLRDSGEIEQDASIAILLWSDKGLNDDVSTRTKKREDSNIIKESELLSNEYNLIRVGVEKHRNGRLGHKYLVYHGAHFDYEDRDEEMITMVSDRELF